MKQSLIADQYNVKSENTFKYKSCKIFRQIFPRYVSHFVLPTIIVNPFKIPSSIFVWNWLVGNGFTKK